MGYIGAGISRFNTADELTVTGDATIDTTTLVVDSTNNRVGVKVAPERDLHVKGSSGDPVHFKLEGDPADYARIMFDDGTTDNIGELRYNFGSDYMSFNTNSAERMRLTSAGSLGLGTTAPSDALHIKTTADADIGLQVQNDDTQAFCKVQSGGTALYGGNGGVNFVSGSGYATRMHITSGGNVGIGTASPTSSSGGKLLAIETAADEHTNLVFNTANTGRNGIIEGRRTGRSGSERFAQINIQNDSDNGEIRFYTAPSGSDVSERMRLTSGGNVSIGTSSALGKLHVHEGARNGGYAINSSYDALVVEGTTHVGISIAGGSNNSGSAAIAFPNGSSSIDGLINYEHAARSLQFYSGGSEKARFLSQATSHFLVGCTSAPSSSVAGTAISTTDAGSFQSFSPATTSSTHAAFGNTNGVVGTIRTTNSTTAYNTSSDRRLKSNIQDAASASDKIDAIQVRQFDWNADDTHQDYGLIAQELQPIEPLAVTGNADSDEMMGVDYSKLVPMLIKEIQELRSRVAALEE